MQIHFSVFFVGALLLLILPFDWIAAVVIAAFFHELCHILTLYALNGRILHISFQPTGCLMEAGRIVEWKQFVSILAGPIGSISLLLLRHTAPQIAICGLIQGLYNLIPALPLDGGRLLTLLVYRFCPEQAERILCFTAMGICIVIDFLAIWCHWAGCAGIWPFLFAIIWNLRFLPRKTPCKPFQIGVQ